MRAEECEELYDISRWTTQEDQESVVIGASVEHGPSSWQDTGMKYENVLTCLKVLTVVIVYCAGFLIYRAENTEEVMGGQWSADLSVKTGDQWWNDKDLQSKVVYGDYLRKDFLDLVAERFYGETQSMLAAANKERDSNSLFIYILLGLTMVITVAGVASMLSTYKFRKARQRIQDEDREKLSYLHDVVARLNMNKSSIRIEEPAQRQLPQIKTSVQIDEPRPRDHPIIGALPGRSLAMQGNSILPGPGRIRETI